MSLTFDKLLDQTVDPEIVYVEICIGNGFGEGFYEETSGTRLSATVAFVIIPSSRQLQKSMELVFTSVCGLVVRKPHESSSLRRGSRRYWSIRG